MCGIVGVVGRDEAAPLLLEALRRLEYRGYDSAGIATLVDGRIERRRAEGRPFDEGLCEEPVLDLLRAWPDDHEAAREEEGDMHRKHARPPVRIGLLYTKLTTPKKNTLSWAFFSPGNPIPILPLPSVYN